MQSGFHLSRSEKATTELYADLHSYASDTFWLDYSLPGFTKHLRQLGLSPESALRGRSFLDAGCGGYAAGVAMALALGAGTVTGIDLSETNIEAARNRFRGIPNVRFQRENLLNIRMEAEVFDFVYCNGVLMVTDDPQQAFRELVRILKPGGRIYIGVYGRGGFYNEVFIPLAKLLGRLIPRRLVSRVLRFIPYLLRPSSSLMDVMYVPREIHYRIPEIEEWFTASGLEPSFLRHYYQPDTRINRLLFGDGTMIFFSAVKP